jgi:hypothetical protein
MLSLRLQAAVRYYQSLGITICRVLIDNGSCYRSKPLPPPAEPLVSAAASPSPTHPEPTARPNVLSKPCEWVYVL